MELFFRSSDLFLEDTEASSGETSASDSSAEEIVNDGIMGFYYTDEEDTDAFVQSDGSEEEEVSADVSDPQEEEEESGPEDADQEENIVQVDETLSAPVYTEDNPMPVYFVEQEELEDESAVYTVSGSPYPGMISTTYLDYFAGIADKLKFTEHYIAFRASQYEYYMAWGEGLEYDGTRFRGSALSYCRIYTGSGSSNMAVTFGSDTFYLTPGTGFVYSDLEHFSSLTEGGTGIESLALLFAVGFAVVYSVCHDLFDYVMQHVYRKSRR